jgi:putative spermidine/putrescine transport system substrate-binding protein
MRNRHARVMAGLVAVCALVVAGPVGAAHAAGGGPQQKIGKGEGKVSILAWAGYAEDGSVDKDVDWVTPFEKQTGCKASVKTFGTSDEAFQLFHTGEYDVVSASGDSSLRSVANGDAAVLNTSLFDSYNDLAPFLKEQRWNTVKGKVYGVPHGWGANLLLFNQDVVTPAPTSWGAVFDADSPYSGKVTAYDSPIYIADAALYLSKSQPDLGITDPYALDQKQFNAAVDLLKQQKGIIGEYWSDALKEQEAFTKGSLVLGTTWQYQTNLIKGDDAAPPVDAILPTEGSTAWSDNWMIHQDAAHPNCAYEWINWITSPEVQAQESEWYGEAPANLAACADTTDPEHCTTYHADDQAFYDQLSYWTTPTTKCVDGRKVKCVAYKGWAKAWDEIKAG